MSKGFSSPSLRRHLPAAALLTLGLALGACTTATPYQPLAAGNKVSGGYSDQRIEADRFRVSFAGNSLTSRETVETYLLYRAAELTVAQRGDWFEMAGRDTERKSNTYVNSFGGGYGGFGGGFGGYGGFGGGYWGPSWGYYRRGFGWNYWDPYGGDPFFGSTVDVRTVDRYQAQAEILLHRGPKPRGNPRAFDAREVLANLGPRIATPR